VIRFAGDPWYLPYWRVIRSWLCSSGLFKHRWETIEGCRRDGSDDDLCDWCCRFRSELDAAEKITVKILMVDGGPVDAEHVEILARLENGTDLAFVNRLLRECKRPATASFRKGA
jgi:hypothetical protein